MKNPFTLERGMEVLEQGGNSAKQQIKTTTQSVTSQVTGQQPNPQNKNGQQPRLDGFKDQILGNPDPQPTLSSVKAQLAGANGSSPQPQKSDAGAQDAAIKQAQDQQLTDEYYGLSNDPQQVAQMQQALNPQNMAAKEQEEQKRQQAAKNQLEYLKREIDDPMAQLRQQRVQDRKQEEQVEEQKKMEELQIQEEKKKEVVKPMQKTAENKNAGAG